MLRKFSIAVALTAVSVLLILASCGKAAAPAIEPTWITPAVSGDTVAIPVSTLEQDTIVHFWVNTPDGKESFMAYIYNGQTHVRADICPPCRSINFRLQGNLLICDACDTTFDAATGKGVGGACVAYAKAAVAYQTSGGNLTMKVADLAKAYRDTLDRNVK